MGAYPEVGEDKIPAELIEGAHEDIWGMIGQDLYEHWCIVDQSHRGDGIGRSSLGSEYKDSEVMPLCLVLQTR